MEGGGGRKVSNDNQDKGERERKRSKSDRRKNASASKTMLIAMPTAKVGMAFKVAPPLPSPHHQG